MQSLWLKSDRRVSIMRLKQSVAARSPNRYIVGFVNDNESEMRMMKLSNGLAAVDGCCNAGKAREKFTYSERKQLQELVKKMLHYLHITSQLYKLNSAETMGLLRFFNWNITRAWVNIKGGHRTVSLDIDVPWQLTVKTPSNTGGLKIFKFDTFYNNFISMPFIHRKYIWRCLINHKFYLPNQQNRLLRLQRCYYDENEFQVSCLLPTEQHPQIEVTALLLPFDNATKAAKLEKLMSGLRVYLPTLLIISKSWQHDPELQQKLLLQCRPATLLMNDLRSYVPYFLNEESEIESEPEQYDCHTILAEAYLAIGNNAILHIFIQESTRIVLGMTWYSF